MIGRALPLVAGPSSQPTPSAMPAHNSRVSRCQPRPCRARCADAHPLRALPAPLLLFSVKPSVRASRISFSYVVQCHLPSCPRTATEQALCRAPTCHAMAALGLPHSGRVLPVHHAVVHLPLRSPCAHRRRCISPHPEQPRPTVSYHRLVRRCQGKTSTSPRARVRRSRERPRGPPVML
jgi:hypothetical protein